MFFYFFSLVGVLSFESIVLWPVWCSSFSASQGVALSAGCLAIFLLSVSACDWGVRFIGLDKVILLFKTLWLNAESSVSSIADLDGVLNLLGLDEILGIWSASWASHLVWLHAASCNVCVSSVTDGNIVSISSFLNVVLWWGCSWGAGDSWSFSGSSFTGWKLFM